MKVTMDDGTVIEGTPEEITEMSRLQEQAEEKPDSVVSLTSGGKISESSINISSDGGEHKIYAGSPNTEEEVDVGDTVKVTGDATVDVTGNSMGNHLAGYGYPGQGVMFVGAKGIVTGSGRNGIHVKFDEDQPKGIGAEYWSFYLLNGEYEVIERDVDKRELLREGMKVRLNAGDCAGKFPLIGLDNGEILVIKDMGPEHSLHDGDIKVKREGDRTLSAIGYALPSQLEVVEDEDDYVKPGDKILIDKADEIHPGYDNGDILTVEKTASEGDVYVRETGTIILSEEFVKYEEGEQYTKLKVGGYAKVNTLGASDLDYGDVVKITGTGRIYDYATHRVSDGVTELFDEEDLIPTTNPKERGFKTGDIVYYRDPKWFENEGYGEVVEGDYVMPIVEAVSREGKTDRYYIDVDVLELVCPAEERHDK